MVVDPAERIKELGRFLSSLKKDKSVNALHREILAGQNNPLWGGFPVEARRARYQNAVDFSEHWTDMCRGRKLPKFDRLVLPTLVALSRDEESLRNHLATAEQLWSAAHQESDTSDAPGTKRAQQQAPPPQPGVTQLTVVAGQGNREYLVDRGSINAGSARTTGGPQSLRFLLLGPVRVNDGNRSVDVGGATARAVLAVLLLRGGGSTDEVISAVWDGPGGATRANVYHYLSGLRRVLHGTGAVLSTRKPRYELMFDPNTVDWHRFRRLAGEARTAREAGDLDRAAGLLHDALALWTGPPLADVGDRLDAFRLDMAEQRRAAVEALATIQAERGHAEDAVAMLQVELATGPVREQATAVLIEALTVLGRRDDATQVFLATRRRLAAEQGLDPGAALADAYRRALDSTPGPVAAAASVAPISGLPRPEAHFAGRTRELATILATLGADGITSPVCAVFGMGGSGKTTLAVHAARQVSDRFQDGILFIDLHGYADDRSALTAEQSLDQLLRRMRVHGGVIPVDLDERSALYQDLLKDRRLLLVLDNARDVAQIRPLLPSAPGCAVIVTSRRRLAALDDALALPLDSLDHDEAIQLFRSVAGEDRLRAEPSAQPRLARVVELCGRLPLAVRIAAGRYRARNKRSLADLEESLSSEDARLTELDDGDRSIAASFLVSLRDLPPPLARTFALLAAHPGADCDVFAAAALVETAPAEAARRLDYLADRHLIAEHAPGRYRLHDLIRLFARQYALAPLPSGDREAALRRLTDYFLRSADAADRLVSPHRHRFELDVLAGSAVLPQLSDYDTAIAWLIAEQNNLADVCLAAAGRFDAACWQLAYTMRGYYFLAKSWQPWIATHQAALEAAVRDGDIRTQAVMLDNLGRAYLESGAPQQAADCYRRAQRLFAAASDRHGETTARADLAWLLYDNARYTEFVDEMRPVLAAYRVDGSERNAAITQRGIGLAEAELGRFADAIADLRQALDICIRLGLRLDIAMTWNGLGETYQRSGDYASAQAAFAEALTASDRAGSAFEQARAHHRLGQLGAAIGDHDIARDHLLTAAAVYSRLGAPQAQQVRRELDELT